MEEKRFMKLNFVSILLIALLIITGCQNIKGKGEDTSVPSPFIGGTKGLEIAFSEQEPPAVVLDNGQQEFFITLLVKNMGEYTIGAENLIATLSGINKESFGLKSLSVKNAVEIPGAHKDADFVTQGGEDTVEFGSATYAHDIPADTSITMRSDVCYLYGTSGISNLCLKKNVLKKDIEDVCSPNAGELKISNSGGPVQVNMLRETTVGSSRVRFAFTVNNVGTGAVYAPGTFKDACAGGDDGKDKVKVTVRNPSNTFSVSCSQLNGGSSGVVRLVNKAKTVECVVDTSGLQETTFFDLLVIDLEYQYREAVKTGITIENAV